MTDSDPIKIAKLQEQMKNLDEKVESGFKDVREDISKLEVSMKEFITKSEDRFAAKWVETGAKALVWVVLTAVITAILSLVLINK